MKLAHLPLNWMYQAAVSHSAGDQSYPWVDLSSVPSAKAGLPARFGLSKLDQIRNSVDSYFKHAKVPTQGMTLNHTVREHGLRYLTWRHALTRNGGFERLQSVMRARIFGDPELKHYFEGEQLFAEQLDALEAAANKHFFKWPGTRSVIESLHGDAREIYRRMKATAPTRALDQFFDEWVHDSYAGFIYKFVEGDLNWAQIALGKGGHRVAEAQRYVRWRGVFAGSNRELNAQLPANSNPGAAKAA